VSEPDDPSRYGNAAEERAAEEWLTQQDHRERRVRVRIGRELTRDELKTLRAARQPWDMLARRAADLRHGGRLAKVTLSGRRCLRVDTMWRAKVANLMTALAPPPSFARASALVSGTLRLSYRSHCRVRYVLLTTGVHHDDPPNATCDCASCGSLPSLITKTETP
jgi:hypothetical protein